MNSETNNCCSCKTKCAYAVAVIGAFFIVAYLVREMKQNTQPAPLDAGRAAERAKALAEIRSDESDKLNNVGWVDPTKGIVRLPISAAMAQLVRDWHDDPAAGRKDLLDRVDKANPPPPPPAPAKPSAFE